VVNSSISHTRYTNTVYPVTRVSAPYAVLSALYSLFLRLHRVEGKTPVHEPAHAPRSPGCRKWDAAIH